MDQPRNRVPEHALRQLLARTRLTEEQLSSHLNNALSETYWRFLNPALSIDGKGACTFLEAKPIDAQRTEELVRRLATEGYFCTESILPASEIGRMRTCIDVLRDGGWPLVFAFLYDEFWLASRSPSLVAFLSAALGPDYKQIPRIWTHYVQPMKNATGWPPHVDGPGKSDRLTVWIPISDATLENGCMYVIPRDVTIRRIGEQFAGLNTIECKDVKVLLQGARALPARAGSILGWAFDVVHWGSACASQGEPRISISMEFISGTARPEKDEQPLLDSHSQLPSFPQRLYAIGTAIQAYERFEPLLIRFVELAKRLLEKVRPLLDVR
jgi:hypothetical protein